MNKKSIPPIVFFSFVIAYMLFSTFAIQFIIDACSTGSAHETMCKPASIAITLLSIWTIGSILYILSMIWIWKKVIRPLSSLAQNVCRISTDVGIDDISDPSTCSSIENLSKKIERLAAKLQDELTAHRQAAEEIERHKRTLERHNSILMEIARNRHSDRYNFAQSLRSITESVTKTIDIQCASVLMFNKERTKLKFFDSYCQQSKLHMSDMELSLENYSNYLRLLNVKNPIAIPDVYNDFRTDEFLSVFRQDNVTSILDAPIWLDNKVVGMLRFSHSGEQRNWDTGEIEFAGAMADSIALSLENNERRKIEHQLRENESYLTNLLDSIPAGVIVIDATLLTILDANAYASNLIGLAKTDLIDKHCFDFFECNNKHNLCKTTHTTEEASENKLKCHDGSSIHILKSSVQIEYNNTLLRVISFIDITKSKKLEQELFNVRKLESVGILAGGIAHDFNNLLTSILGNITLAMLDVEPETELYQSLSNAEKASLRAKDLSGQLLSFSRAGSPIKKTVAIYDLIKDTAKFASRGSNVRCDIVLPEGLYTVDIDTGQISQVINNMVINAIQAMPLGGIVSIKAQNITLTTDNSLPLPEGEYLLISIEDQGCGISAENRSKIFDPYFTTKKAGTGLGLATCFSIIKNHAGYIKLHSTVNVGTTFQIYIPKSTHPMTTEIEAEQIPAKGYGKILIMDDEEMVRTTLAGMLSAIGYQSEFAQDGSQAIELYEQSVQNNSPFNAIIMDLTVPGGMGGKDTINKLKSCYPTVTAIVSSGYANDPVIAEYQQYGFKGVVSKPYRLNELSSVLQKVIQSATITTSQSENDAASV